MRRQKQKDTAPELTVRRALHAHGIRFRIRNRDLPGSPDIANRSKKWAIFVHGCYWHHHDGCARATVPKRNTAFWKKKFEANRRRDAMSVAKLEQSGYTVIIMWECELSEPKTINSIISRLAY